MEPQHQPTTHKEDKKAKLDKKVIKAKITEREKLVSDKKIINK